MWVAATAVLLQRAFAMPPGSSLGNAEPLLLSLDRLPLHIECPHCC
jgi:hypothetical protein